MILSQNGNCTVVSQRIMMTDSLLLAVANWVATCDESNREVYCNRCGGDGTQERHYSLVNC